MYETDNIIFTSPVSKPLVGKYFNSVGRTDIPESHRPRSGMLIWSANLLTSRIACRLLDTWISDPVVQSSERTSHAFVPQFFFNFF